MKFTVAVCHALRIMAYMAVHKKANGTELAKALGIPVHSMSRNALNHLTRAHILGGVRGAKGGYCLHRDPETISLLEIVQAVDGPINLGGGDIQLNSSPGALQVLDVATAALVAVLEKTTALDLAKEGS